MKTSEAIDQIAAALAAAQGTMDPALFNRENPHFHSRYADLAAIMQATLPALSKNGLALVQTPTLTDQGNFVLMARLIHKSGQWIEALWPLTIGTPQAMGSQLTYARRYTWSALCGIASEEDDDAEVAEYSERQGLKAGTGEKRSAHRARKDGDWEAIVEEMRRAPDLLTLRTIWLANQDRIKTFPDNWIAHLNSEKERIKSELEEGVNEEGKEVE